jgi:hypothetical protein
MDSDKDSVISQLKSQLEASSGAHKKAFNTELKEIFGQAENVGKKALVVGGSLLLTYLIYKKFFAQEVGEPEASAATSDEGATRPTTAKPSKRGGFVLAKSESMFNTMLDELGVMLLTMARQKLLEFLAQLASDENESAGDPATKD